MKLPIKRKYFDMIKSGVKNWEYRDAHITFICEDTHETLTKRIRGVHIMHKNNLPDNVIKDDDLFDDEFIIAFKLMPYK